MTRRARKPLPPMLAAVLARLGAQAARMRARDLDRRAARLEREALERVAVDLTDEAEVVG